MKKLQVSKDQNIEFKICRKLVVDSNITYDNVCGAKYSKGFILDYSTSKIKLI